MAAVTIVLSTWGSIAGADETFIKTGGRTTMPIGHYDFCKREPDECNQLTPKQEPIEMTEDLWSALAEVNSKVNASVKNRSDQLVWGLEEHWSVPSDAGDTEDFAIEKRRRLMERGIPAGSLLIAVASGIDGSGHAPLVVRTSIGDFVLSDLETEVLPWRESKYNFLKIQSERNSGVWVSVVNGCTPAYAAVKPCE